MKAILALMMAAVLQGGLDEKVVKQGFPVRQDQLREFYKARAESGFSLEYPRIGLGRQLTQGQVGTFQTTLGVDGESQSASVKLLQVTRDTEAIALVTFSGITKGVFGSGGSSGSAPAIVLGSEAAIPRNIPWDKTVTVLLRGFDFTNAVNDQLWTYEEPVIVEGTYDYTTVAGVSNKIPVIEPIKLDPPPKHPVLLGIGVRTWKDNTGQFEIEAAYESYADGVVRLIKAKDAEELGVPLQRLSREDQAFVREKIREEREAENNANNDATN